MPVKNLIFDVGLHRGEDTEFYLRKGFRVVAFEANPELVEHCKKAFSQEISEDRLTIIEGAIVDDPERDMVRFYTTPDKTVFGTVDPDWAQRNESHGVQSQVVDVPAVDFEAALREHGVPYYLKIDIEGMDGVCLDALTSFDDRPAYVSIESDKTDFSRVEAEIDKLQALGYSSFQAVQQFGMPRRREPNPPREGAFSGQRFAEGSSGLFGKDLPDTWKGRNEVLSEYERIFMAYERFGDSSWWRQHTLTRIFLKALERLIGIPMPGWYDTHAKHEKA